MGCRHEDANSHHEGFLYSWQLEAYLAWHLERYSFANQSAALLEENAFFDDEQTRKDLLPTHHLPLRLS